MESIEKVTIKETTLQINRLKMDGENCKDPMNLFISYGQPHGPVSKSTAARWIRLTITYIVQDRH